MYFRFILLAAFMVTLVLIRLDCLERDGDEGLWAMYGLAGLFLVSSFFTDFLCAMWERPAGGLLLVPLAFIACYLLAIAAIIIYGSASLADGTERFILVPGTKTVAGKPSCLLRGRLDAAAELMHKEAQTICVVSGGDAAGTDTTEAAVMSRYLAGCGISPERIHTEDRSTSTYKNFENSLPVLRACGMSDSDTLVICTDLFHYARCAWLAHKLGYKKLRLKPSKNGSRHAASWFFREIMVFVRLFLSGPAYQNSKK